MGSFDIFDTIDGLRRAGRPFCVATVVRTADVTSAKAGAKAAVTDEGEVLGHLGGACVLRAVREAGREALHIGQTRMIRIKPANRVVALHDEDGAQVFRSGCPSGGTVDLLIEPYTVPPLLVIFGKTPISQALAAHGALAGYRVATQSEANAPDAHLSFDGANIDDLRIAPGDFVVVASQGADDLASLRAALKSPARRVSMVASRRKADALITRLRAEGMEEARIANLKSPAGLDLKGVDPHDIALSVLAEIVMWRNSDRASKDEGEAHEHSA
ncbi:MAG: XdhC family protein [Pseudomonadota bacterium]